MIEYACRRIVGDMADRLTIINDALLNTGNSPCNEEYDGSDEWQASDSAYRRAVSHLISQHVWNFATTTAPLASVVPSPSGYRRFASAYVPPGDCFHIEGVFLYGRPFTDYEVVDQKICCQPASGLTVKYVRVPIEDQFPPGFVELLTVKVEAYLLRSLNEDTDNATRRDSVVKEMLQDYRATSDEQEGRTAETVSPSMRRRRGYGGFGGRGYGRGGDC